MTQSHLEDLMSLDGEISHQEKLLNWIARIGGGLISAVWLFSLVSSTIQDSLRDRFQWSLEGSLLVLLVGASAVGVGIGWKDRINGGKITIICSLFLSIFSYFSAGQNQLFAVACSGLPFFLVGLLFLQSGASQPEQPSG